MSTGSHDLKERVLAAAQATPSATRAEARRRDALRFGVALVVGVAVFEAAGGIEHSSGRPVALTLMIAGGWGAYCLALSFWVLFRGRSTLGRLPRRVLVAALITPAVLLAWMAAFHGTYVEPFERVGVRCFALTLSMAALPLATLLAARRGAEPRHPAALGAGLGAVSGAWAGMALHLWCPLINVPHVLVGHVLPLLVLIALGARFGRRTLGIPSA